MDKSKFEELMYAEYKKNTLDRYVDNCEDPMFDLVWDLRDRLYEFFHPLGIHSKGIHDCCDVFANIRHAEIDDGDLSIVFAYLDCSDSAKAEHDKMIARIQKIVQKKITIKKLLALEIFVMTGDHRELNEDSVREAALKHRSDNEFIVSSYTARRFGYDELRKLHSLLPRFEEEKRLGGGNDPDTYFKYVRETKRLIKED